ncbi:MAG TPA: hypothetical protein VHX15_20700 [Frankiaceae bacterium]|nr:hypothetical protein [Frankiaceae bacterium]
MRVEFYRNDEARVSSWDAFLGKRSHVPGATMALGRGLISHDLAQYVIEATTGYEHGFWGLLAAGATFKSTGRRRTKPGRGVIATHRQELLASEQLAGLHLDAWQRGQVTPVTACLTLASQQFQALRPNERLAFTWPSSSGQVFATSGGPGGKRGGRYAAA